MTKPTGRANSSRPQAVTPDTPSTATHPTCKICNSPQRREIELALLLGGSREEIAQRFTTGEESFNRQNMFSHFHNHMAVIDSALLALAEKEQRQRALDVRTATVALARRKQLLRDLLEDGLDAVTSGAVKWSLRDALSLSAELEQLEASERETSLAEVMRDSRFFSDAVHQIVPQRYWNEIVERFDEATAAITDPWLILHDTTDGRGPRDETPLHETR